MVSQAELILRVITLWFLLLSQFFKDGMCPFNDTNGLMKVDSLNPQATHLGVSNYWVQLDTFLKKSQLPKAEGHYSCWKVNT